MSPIYSTSTQKQILDDDSDGEEEIISTWKVTNPGKITVVQKTNEPRRRPAPSKKAVAMKKPQPISAPLKPALGLNSQRNIRPKPSVSSVSNAPRPPAVAPMTTAKPVPVPVPAPGTVAKPAAMKAIWYLGGNHVVKLLTSVDGDLDPLVLSKLEAVPSVVGELALSVESLVSDDFTVGGFESDLLAKIAANTLAAKRASSLTLAPKASPVVHVQHQPASVDRPAHGEAHSVPNPLAARNPVPNPLARITPPGSPSVFNTDASNKRKAPANTNAMRKTKAPRSDTTTTLIQAR